MTFVVDIFVFFEGLDMPWYVNWATSFCFPHTRLVTDLFKCSYTPFASQILVTKWCSGHVMFLNLLCHLLFRIDYLIMDLGENIYQNRK